MTFLGLDLGTSGLRAVLMDAQGNILGVAEQSYGVNQPHVGWSEQDPNDWITALEGAIGEIRSLCPAFADLGGVGVAGHMHGATLLDAQDRVLRPCILWNDTRAHVEAAEMDSNPAFRAISGNIVFPGFTAPKLMWLQTHEPEVFKRINKVLLPAAFINHYLTGDYVCDMSDAAGTAWLDVEKRAWSQILLDLGGMDIDHMPRLVEGSEPAGQLRGTLAKRWGVSNRVVIAGGASDNAAAACGIGAVSEGQGFVSLGTSGVILAARDGYAPAPETALHSFCHALPDRWYQMGVMLSATDSLNWLSTITGASPPKLTDALGDQLRAPSSVRFLPYLAGERTPHNDAEIRGSFTGLGTGTTRLDLTQAVLEGVCFGLRDGFDALGSAGASPRRLTAIGGGTKSRYWLELLATVLGVDLEVPKNGEFGAALGAARLAQSAHSGYPRPDIMQPPEIGETIHPNPTLKPAFQEAYDQYRATYPAIKSIQ